MDKSLHNLFRYIFDCLGLIVDRNHYASNGFHFELVGRPNRTSRTGQAPGHARFSGGSHDTRVARLGRENPGASHEGDALQCRIPFVAVSAWSRSSTNVQYSDWQPPRNEGC
jgi:hypothetical protein